MPGRDPRPFSRRHGYRSQEREITVREDAPDDLRHAIVMLGERLGLNPGNMRLEICSILLKQPNPNNWSPYPNIFGEVMYLIETCPWHKVYDIAEGFYERLASMDEADNAEDFEHSLNDFLVENGIGWAKEGGQIVVRGSESFSAVPHEAIEALQQEGLNTAATEIHEAIQDLSRRLAPDISGSIQHAMAALECVVRELTGEHRKTLGRIIADHREELGIPRPLDEALEKMWGYASEMGRHLREGHEPKFEEAELVVTVSAAGSIYLTRRSVIGQTND